MPHHCPQCGHPLPTRASGSLSTVERLCAWCEDHGHVVWPDHSVYEPVAAVILGRKPGTLRNHRSQGRSVPWYRSGRTGRVRYRLQDLADELDAQRRDSTSLHD